MLWRRKTVERNGPMLIGGGRVRHHYEEERRMR